jgi:predicted kinase
VKIPELCVVALVGVSGSGKSTFAHRHFAPTEVLSSDQFRGLVADDENDQSATDDAFDALYHVARKRLARRRLTVIDATHVQRHARKAVLSLAREFIPYGTVVRTRERVTRRARCAPARWSA